MSDANRKWVRAFVDYAGLLAFVARRKKAA